MTVRAKGSGAGDMGAALGIGAVPGLVARPPAPAVATGPPHAAQNLAVDTSAAPHLAQEAMSAVSHDLSSQVQRAGRGGPNATAPASMGGSARVLHLGHGTRDRRGGHARHERRLRQRRACRRPTGRVTRCARGHAGRRSWERRGLRLEHGVGRFDRHGRRARGRARRGDGAAFVRRTPSRSRSHSPSRASLIPRAPGTSLSPPTS